MPLPTAYSWTISPGEDPPAPPAAPSLPEEGDATVQEIVVIAHDIIRVVFNMNMKSDAAMALKTNYIVDESGGNGIPVVVRGVLVPRGTTVDTIELVVSDFTVGEKYYVIANNLVTPAGVSISEFNAAPFIGRRTKVDSMMESMPALYNLNPGSDLRGLFNAIGMADDLIGGSRNDRLVGEVAVYGDFNVDPNAITTSEVFGDAEVEVAVSGVSRVGYKVTSFVVSPPSTTIEIDTIDEDLEVGDLLVALGYIFEGGFGIVAPAGWTQFAGDAFEFGYGAYKYAEAGDLASPTFTIAEGADDPFNPGNPAQINATAYAVLLSYRGVNQTTPWGAGAEAGTNAATDPAVAPGAGASTGALGATVIRAYLSDTQLFTPATATLVVRDGDAGSWLTIAESVIVGAEDPLTEEDAAVFSGSASSTSSLSIPLEPA